MTTVYEVVQQICLGLPGTEEFLSHGSPAFRATGKTFATYSLNHHGDGKVALILNLSKDMQKMLVDSAPVHFFIPPYTGPKGWVGVELDKGIRWDRVSELAFEAYCQAVPTALSNELTPVKVTPPTQKMKPEDIDPYVSATNMKLLQGLRDRCLVLPEVTEAKQFGSPCFKAGKKTFCNLHQYEGHTELQIWVGMDRQLALTSFDERYRIPAYTGHNGWISFDLSGKPNWQEITALLKESYRHFALKRMLNVLGD